MSESLFEAIRDKILQQHLDDRTKVHLTLTSKEHANEFPKRCEYVHILFESIAQKNEQCTKYESSDWLQRNPYVYYIPWERRESPRQASIWCIRSKIAWSRLITVMNYCGRAIVTMNEYVDADPDKQYISTNLATVIWECLLNQFSLRCS